MDELKSLALCSDVLLAVGGAAAAAGIVLLVVGSRAEKKGKGGVQVAFAAPAGITFIWGYQP